MRITNYLNGGSQITSLQEIKTFLNILHEDDDLLLNSLINPAQSQVENDTDLILTNSQYEDIFYEEDEFVLAKKPVSQITEISLWSLGINGNPGYWSSYYQPFDSLDVEIFQKQLGNTIVKIGSSFDKSNKYKITYSCESSRYQLLAIAKQAVLMLIASMYLNREAIVNTAVKESPLYKNLINAMRDQ